MKNILLTIAIPTFNRETTLGKCLNSICHLIDYSEYKNRINVVISENHSTDKTRDVAETFAKSYSFLKIISPPIHLNSGEENVSFLLDNIKSEYVWTLADDDTVKPDSLDMLLNILEKYRTVDFFLLNCSYIDANCEHNHSIIKSNKDIIFYENFRQLVLEFGPQTILALFSAHIFKLDLVRKISIEEFSKNSVIYSHVFRYLRAFNNSSCAVVANPLITANQTTDPNHWNNASKKMGWYKRYPWVGGMLRHLSNCINNNDLDISEVSNCLNTTENVRYGLLNHILINFLFQLIEGLKEREVNEIPSIVEIEILKDFCVRTNYINQEIISYLYLILKTHDFIIESLTNPAQAILMGNVYGLSIGKAFGETQGIQNIIELTISFLIEEANRLVPLIVDIGSGNQVLKPPIIWKNDDLIIVQHGAKFICMNNDVYDNELNSISFDNVDLSEGLLSFGFYKEFRHFSSAREYVLLYSERGILNAINLDSKEQIKRYAFNILMNEECTDLIQKLFGADTEDALEINSNDSLVISSTIIDIDWYISTFATRVPSKEKFALRSLPIAHWIAFGIKRGWSISPYLKSLTLYEPRNFHVSKTIRNLLNFISFKDFLNGPQATDNILFDEVFYYNQLKNLGQRVDVSFVNHYIETGYQYGLLPFENWDEHNYLLKNPDVELSDYGKNHMAWFHWCRHGRFENRVF